MFFLLAVSWTAFLSVGPGPKADRPVPAQVQIVTLKQLALLVNRDEIPCSWRLMSTGCLLNSSGNVFTLDEAARASANYAKKSTHKQVVLRVLEPDKTQTERLRKFMIYLEAALEKGQFVVVFVVLIEPE